MPLPEGVAPDQNAVKVSVGKEPVLFRSFVTGGGVRSILVGFPGDAAYAFDADECRLEFAWTGEFLDVRPVWMERGGQKAVPLGERWFMAPDGFPLRIGDRSKAGKPRFRGYDLDGKRVPTFRYEVDGAEVRDRMEPGPSGVGLVRSIEVRGRRLGDVWYVPGAAAGVAVTSAAERTSDGAFHVRAQNGVARLQITIAPAKPTQAAARP
jgi:hypothetical protein